MTSRVSIKNKEKKAKTKNSVKKTDKTVKQKRYKETENSVQTPLTTAPQRHTCIFEKLILSYQNNFSLP